MSTLPSPSLALHVFISVFLDLVLCLFVSFYLLVYLYVNVSLILILSCVALHVHSAKFFPNSKRLYFSLSLSILVSLYLVSCLFVSFSLLGYLHGCLTSVCILLIINTFCHFYTQCLFSLLFCFVVLCYLLFIFFFAVRSTWNINKWWFLNLWTFVF